jgi:sigma-B regulation protein RsbU (phosphoserine phosphatase)
MWVKKPKVLIIDDTPANIQILHEIFRDEYDIYFATSGADGIAVAHRELPDLILLDIMMPEMDGYEACAILKSDSVTMSIPVIFVTAMGEEEDETRGIEAGAIDYLTKPISPPIVKARVRNHLELKRGRDMLEQVGRDLAAKNATLEQERSLAHRLLGNILPERLNIPGFSTAVIFRPSDQIGGDFFDGWIDGDNAHFLIGDISGHSISAALLMAVCKGLFSSLGKGKNDPAEIVATANGTLCPMILESGMYLTMVYLLCDRQRGIVRIVSAGHNPAYLFTPSGTRTIESTGPAIGWDPGDCWEVVEYPFIPGDIILLYTDGLVEAVNNESDVFGTEIFSGLEASGSADELVNSLFLSAKSFCKDVFSDDVTLFAIERHDHGE